MKQSFRIKEGTVIRNIKLRIYPNDFYKEKLKECFLARHIVYNHLVKYNEKVYEQRRTYDYYFNLRKELMRLRESNEFPLLNKVDSHMLRECVEDLDNGYKNYLNKYKNKPPQVATGIATTCRFAEGIRISYKRSKLYFPKLEDRYLKTETKMKDPKYGIKYSGLPNKKYRIIKITHCSVTQDLLSRWFATITVHAIPLKHTEPKDIRVGIDVGIGRLATDTEGGFYSIPANKDVWNKYIRYIRLYLQYKRIGNQNLYLYYKNKARQYYYKHKYFRIDFAHKLSRYYINTFKELAIEDIDMFNMVRSYNNLSFRAKLKFKTYSRCKFINKKIMNSNIGSFLKGIIYKAQENNNKVFIVNKAYTSICCSNCLVIDANSRKNQKFKCTKCGYTNHADVNAAINIKRISYLTPKAISEQVIPSAGVIDVNLKSL